ncbi:MAG: DUF2341 domain-containing protein [Spirochaetia bacterium]
MKEKPPSHPFLLGAVTLLLLACSLPLLESCTPEGSWDIIGHNLFLLEKPEWHRRIKLSVDNSSGTETLADFPVLVSLDSSRIDYGECLPEGADLQFRALDGETVLPHEIDTWNPLGTSSIWVRLAEIPAGSTDTYFYLYYNSITPPEEPAPGAVWNDDYVGVWHLNEPGGADGSTYSDSTYNRLDAEGGVGSRTSPAGTGGKIGRGQDFSGMDTHRIDLPGSPLLDDLGPVTFSFWVYDYGAAAVGSERIIHKNRLDIRNGEQGGNPTLVFERTFSMNNLFKAFMNPWTYDTWDYVTLTWIGSDDEDDVLLYSNVPPPLGDFNRNDGIGTIETDSISNLTLGNTFWESSDNFNGIIDELRISSVVRSAAWVDAQHRSMTDTMLTYSAPEEITAR